MRQNGPMRNRLLTAALTIAAFGASGAAFQDPIDRIREADLKRDLFALAGDAMRGREGGTLDEMTASAWVAERAREAGLLPAGDNGTYFQFFPLERLRVSASSTVTLGRQDAAHGPWTSCPTRPSLANVDAPVTMAPGDKHRGSRHQGSRAGRPLRAGAAGDRQRRCVRGCAASSEWRRRVRRRRPSSRSCPTRPLSNGSAWPFRFRAAPTASIRTARRSRAWRHAGMPLLYVRESALGGPLKDDARLRGSLRRSSPTASRIRPSTSSPRCRAAIGGSPTSTCCSARTRITTASAIRSTATTSGTAPTTTRRRRSRCWRSAAPWPRGRGAARRCSSGTERKSAA